MEFCDDHHIRVDWASVAHPQTNGQVERANGMILQGLKPRIFNRLNKSSRKWLQEMSSVIWSLRTTPKRAMGFTSFFLVYGTEAVLPTDLEYGSAKIKDYDESSNQRARKDSLDQIYEAHDVAMMHSARYQQALRRYQSLENLAPRFQRGRLSPKAEPKQSRPPQVVTTMGGALRRRRGAQAQHVQAGKRARRSTHQHLEHPTAMSLLPLRSSKYFCTYPTPQSAVQMSIFF
jgi:hypothetical protein